MINLEAAASGAVAAALHWAAPWWWVCVGGAGLTLALFNVLPVSVPPAKADEYGLADLAKIGLRVVALVTLLVMLVCFVPAVYMGTLAVLGSDAGHEWIVREAGRQARSWGWLPVLAVMLGLAGRVVVSRYVAPRFSQWKQRLIVRQEDHKQSDMRHELGRLKPRDFDPRAHYRPAQMFMGLDVDGRPVHIDTRIFCATHMQVIGPTRFGKGVLLGGLLEQAIEQGHGAVYIDPKGDAFVPYIMAAACERAGRRFVYLDLAGEDTRWSPFEGGSPRDRRARICNAADLNNAGDGGDFYKSRERAILDTIMPGSGTSIAGLRAALEQRGPDGKPLKEAASRLSDSLIEFGMLPALNPRKGGGIKIGDALKAGASIYVRGSLDDAVVRRATRVFLSEVIQEARRLDGARPNHLTLAVDELKFMISQEVSDALATIAGYRANMILLHQSIGDLRGPEDRGLNAVALESSVIVNCQIKLMYRASDPETAEWASLLSGTKIERATKSVMVEHNRLGGEAYGTARQLTDLEVPVIPPNQLLGLSPRVGVLFMPERLASVVFTCFVKADTQRALYQRPQAAAAPATPTAPSTPAEPTPG